MKKMLYWLIPLLTVMAVLLLTIEGKAGIYSSATTTTEDSINIPFQMLDSLGNPVLRTTGDSLWIVVYYPGGYQLFADSCRILSDAKIIHRQLNIRALTTSIMTYRNSVTAIDGTVQNGTYKYFWIAYDSSLALTTTGDGEFQVYTTTTFSALSNGQKYDNDSLVFGATLDNPSFLSVGTNAGTVTINGGVAITNSNAGAGLAITGGTGAAGHAVSLTGGSTSGNGLLATGTGNFAGILGAGQGTGAGLQATGGATGNGATFSGGGTSGHGIATTGVGAFAGLRAIGGNNAAGHGIHATSGTTNAASGILASSGATNGTGMTLTGTGTGIGLTVTGGATGNGANFSGGGTSGHGISATGVGAFNGIRATGGNNAAGHGFYAISGTTAAASGIYATNGNANGTAVTFLGTGTGTALTVTGGATGGGAIFSGGATSGSGVTFTKTGAVAGSHDVTLTNNDFDSLTFVTTAGTAAAVTTVNGLAANVITTASINDGALTKADHHADFWQALRDTVWNADSTMYANDAGSMAKAASATGSSTGLDSATTSRIIRRTVWGIPLGSGSDSVDISLRKVTATATVDSTSVSRYVWNTPFDNINDKPASVGDSLYRLQGTIRDIVGDTVRKALGDTLGTFSAAATLVDNVWDEALSGHGTAGTAGEFLDGILDTIRAHAPHANNWGGTAASSLDSSVVSRISRRMWGVQLGATGSSDSLTLAQRVGALPFGDSTRKAIGDTFNVISGGVLLSSGTGTGQVSITSGVVSSNMTQIAGSAVNTGTAQIGANIVSVTDGAIVDADLADNIKVDVNSISTSTLAADNLEAAIDTDSSTWAPRLQLRQLQIEANAGGGTSGIYVKGSANGPGLSITGGAGGSYAAQIVGQTDQGGLFLSSGASSGYGLALSGTSGDLSGALTTLNFGTGALTENDFADGALRFGFEITGGLDSTMTSRILGRKIWGIAAGTGSDSVTWTNRTANTPTGTGLDSATTSRIIKRTVWGYAGGSTGADSTTVANRTVTGGGGGVATIYPLLERMVEIDAPGAAGLEKYMFVVDTTALGSSNAYSFLNKGVTVRDSSANAGKNIGVGIIERVGVDLAAGVCSLQVSDSLPFQVAKGDTLWIWSNGPQYIFALLGDALGAQRDTILNTDTTLWVDSLGSMGQQIARGGSGDFAQVFGDTITTLHRILTEFSDEGTVSGIPRRSELLSARQMTDSILERDSTEFSNDANIGGAIVAGSRTDNVNLTAGNIDDIVDGVIAGVALGSGTGIYSMTMFAVDTFSTPDVAVSGIDITATSGPTLLYATTGPTGSVTFNMDAGTWIFSALGSPYTWVPFTRAVSASDVDTINGGGVTVLAPSSPATVVIYGRLTSSAGTPLVGASVVMELTNYDDSLLYLSGGEQVVPTLSTATSDENGYWSLEVVPNYSFDDKSRYILRVAHPDARWTPRTLKAIPRFTNFINVKDLY